MSIFLLDEHMLFIFVFYVKNRHNDLKNEIR